MKTKDPLRSLRYLLITLFLSGLLITIGFFIWGGVLSGGVYAPETSAPAENTPAQQ